MALERTNVSNLKNALLLLLIISSDLINNDTVKWWSGFYTYATTFNLTAALNPSSANYQLLLRDIDAIAVQLLRLQAANIPVLWRPLHEAEGGWFWWGAFGPENAKTLYRLVYKRLTETHKLRNLIWVWNSVSPAWYPGDDVVDICFYRASCINHELILRFLQKIYRPCPIKSCI